METNEQVIEHLTELLFQKTERIEKLEERVEELEAAAKSRWRWTLHEKVEPHELLPVPRLEILWRPAPENAGYQWEARYQLVYQFFDELVGVPLSSTLTSGCEDREPMRHMSGYPIPTLPFRDGVHLYRDMAHLKMRAFVRSGFEIIYEIFLDEGNEPLLLEDKDE